MLSLLPVAALLIGEAALFASPSGAAAFPTSEAGGFNPGLLVFAGIAILVMVVACLLLVGLGLAGGIIISALAGALTVFGILSSSVALGLIRRSPASGFRALFVQVGAVAGIPCGIGAMWLVAWVAAIHWSIATRLLVGGVCGMLCGVAVALLFNFAWGRAVAWLLGRYERREKSDEVVN